MLSIQARSLQKFYQGRPVLDLSVALEADLLYAVLGPNGSGKSTLLRLLSLVEEPDQGEVVFRDGIRQLAKNLALRRRIVLVPDRKGLFNETAAANVDYGLRLRRLPGAERERRVEEALRAVGLWGLRQANGLSLSTGESQRLCLAMALAVQPEIILLDEPTSSLDPYNVGLVEDIIREMKNQARLILLVTHNIFQAKRVADRVLFLFQGRLMEETPTERFFERPASETARTFMAGELVC